MKKSHPFSFRFFKFYLDSPLLQQRSVMVGRWKKRYSLGIQHEASSKRKGPNYDTLSLDTLSVIPLSSLPFEPLSLSAAFLTLLFPSLFLFPEKAASAGRVTMGGFQTRANWVKGTRHGRSLVDHRARQPSDSHVFRLPSYRGHWSSGNGGNGPILSRRESVKACPVKLSSHSLQLSNILLSNANYFGLV